MVTSNLGRKTLISFDFKSNDSNKWLKKIFDDDLRILNNWGSIIFLLSSIVPR